MWGGLWFPGTEIQGAPLISTIGEVHSVTWGKGEGNGGKKASIELHEYIPDVSDGTRRGPRA